MELLRKIVRKNIYVLVFLLSACGGSVDDSVCGDIKAQEYMVTNYVASPVLYPKAINEQSDGDLTTDITNSNPVDWTRFSIYIKGTYQIYSVQHSPFFRFSLFEQALACSPRIAAKQSLGNISITSANAFSDAYPAGSDLSSLFAIIAYPCTSLVNLKGDAPQSLKLKLLSAPQYANQNFEIQITLSDGNIFTVRTGDVYFSVQ